MGSMDSMDDMQLVQRVEDRVREWDVVVENKLETESSLIIFGRRENHPVVLKVLRHQSDEWRSGEILDAFAGAGTVRVYEYIDGAVLLEKLNPGTSLAQLSLNGRDEEATEILADVIHKMSQPRKSPDNVVSVKGWGRGFHEYLTSGDAQIPGRLVKQGHYWYTELCASEKDVRLLHGDLQHYNVLYDYERGWTAIDPKGVVGETEYETGASLRNPIENPELLASVKTVERRLRQYEDKLRLDSDRVLKWAFAQAVLSAIWAIEDGFPVDARNASMMLAHTIGPML